MSEHVLGRFITLEGSEGVGKTTVMASLYERLTQRGIDVIKTREPGGSPLAEALRAMLIDPDTHISDDTELLLMFTARSDHIHKTIVPALQAGTWVLCDRFIDSSVAYQGFGRGHGDATMLAKIDALIQAFVPCLPDKTLWLDLPVAEGMARAGTRGQADRFEAEHTAFFERVQQGFAHQYRKQPSIIQKIDATGSPAEVSQRAWHAIADLMEQHGDV